MKPLHLLGLTAAMSALLIFAAAEADAQAPIVPIVSGGGGPRIVPLSNGGHLQGGGARFTSPGHGGHGGGRRRFHGFGGFGGVWIVEREVPIIIEREVVREVQVPAEPPPPPPRKPYVIGASYASLPGGCMKLIEEGTSYYYCSGEWYRQVDAGRYRAVAAP